MNDPAGRLQIHLHRQTGGLGVRIQSSRLTSASRVFIGKDLTATLETLPRLFSVCATAQTVACVSAGEAALGIPPHPRALATRLLLVDLETVREHLWRLLLDWPRFLGESPQGAAMAQVMAAFDQGRRALAANGDPLRTGPGRGTGAIRPDAATVAVATASAATAPTAALTALAAITRRQVLGQPPGDWLATTRDLQTLRHWARTSDTAAARLIDLVDRQGWAGLGRSPVAVLPPLTLATLEARLSGPGAEAFIATPLWQGAAAESTPFARQRNQPLVADLARELGNGLLPRLAAQLVELSSLLVALPRRLVALAESVPSDAHSYDSFDKPFGEPHAESIDEQLDPPAPQSIIPSVNGAEELLAAGQVPAVDPELTNPSSNTPERLALRAPPRPGPSAKVVPAQGETPQSPHTAATLSTGTGLAQVQAARGLLVHRLTLEQGRLADYRILAPTEWNFHPQGAAALGLATLPAADEPTLRRLAGLFITALDPCVAYDISIS